MKFTFKKPKESIASLARIIGYRLIETTSDGEFNLIRPPSYDYPRFHLFLKNQENTLKFNLHLDQKKPSYQGQTAHSGEYNGALVEAEKQRIEQILKKMIV